MVTGLLSEVPDPDTILIAAHDNNADCRPVSTYDYTKIRAIHIDGVRYISRLTDLPETPEAPPAASPEIPAPEEDILPPVG